MAQQIQLRNGTSTEWTAANPLLAKGEAGVETNTNKMKVGDGITYWNSLPYTASKGDTGVGVPIGGTTGQVLIKNSSTDYDTGWTTISTKRSFNIMVHSQASAAFTPGFLYAFPGTSPSGSYSGFSSSAVYPSIIPYTCALTTANIIFSGATFTNRPTAGAIYIELGFYNHTYSGSTETIKFNIPMDTTFTGTTAYPATYSYPVNSSNFSIVTGTNSFGQGTVFGVQFKNDVSQAGQISQLSNPLICLTFTEL